MLKGVEGFGIRGHVRSARVVDFASDLPVHYGRHSVVVPYRRVAAIELGERLLRGTFTIAAGQLFLDLGHVIRQGAGL